CDLEPLRPLLGLQGIAPDERLHLEPGRAQRAHMREASEPGADDGDSDGHLRPTLGRCSSVSGTSMPAVLATIDNIVYWPTTKRISTSAGGSKCVASSRHVASVTSQPRWSSSAACRSTASRG